MGKWFSRMSERSSLELRIKYIQLLSDVIHFYNKLNVTSGYLLLVFLLIDTLFSRKNVPYFLA